MFQLKIAHSKHLMKIAKLRIENFKDEVWKYWNRYGRHELAWRKTKNPYRILVSEVMLQQTQVARVTEKYPEFLAAFPTVHKLTKAPLSQLFRSWSGMGYNRRAKYLRDSAKVIVEKYKGQIPRSREALEGLAGVGKYTAAAVRVFAFNEPDVLIETNIRAAIIHYFYASVLQNTSIEDSKILPIATAAAEGQDPRKWHWALMDYGVYIKRLHKNPARKSAHYLRQSKFEGSLRQVRGAILRTLITGSKTQESIYGLIRENKRIVDKALASLAHDGLMFKKGSLWRV